MQTVNSFSLVHADESHIEMIYAWQTFPRTRQFSNKVEIPTWLEHSAWMRQKLLSDRDFFYLVRNKTTQEYCAAVRLDAVRLDKETPSHFVISIFLNPEFYGRGIGSDALALIDDVHPDIEIHAKVLRDNHASQRLFEKAGYSRINDELFIRKLMK